MSIHLVTIHSSSAEKQKVTKNKYFGGLRSFKVIDVDIPKKLIVSEDNIYKQLCCK